MDRAAFETYLERFHARDYDAVLSYYEEPFELSFAGYTFRTKDEVRRFYALIHDHMTETLNLKAHVSDGAMMAIEAHVALVCTKDLPAETLAAAGLDRIAPMTKGQSITIPEFIHYHFNADGKIVKVECVVSAPPY